MDKETLKKAVKGNLKFVKTHFEESDGEGFTTMFMVEATKDGKKTGIVAMPGNEGAMENRDKMVFHLGLRAYIEKMKGTLDTIDGIFMMSEAWFSVAAKNSKEWPKDLMPSKDPNKKEAIISAGLVEDGTSYLEMFELKRSFDLKNSKLQVSFETLSDMGSSDAEAKSPLLERFWDGVKLMKHMESEMPETIKATVDKLTSEKFFEIVLKQLDQAAEMYEVFNSKK